MLIAKGKPKKVAGAKEEQPKEPSTAPALLKTEPKAELPAEPPRKATRPVTAAELLMVRSEAPMIPIQDSAQKGTRWRFRHPDLDGSSYSGTVYLGQLNRYVVAEEGFISTDKPEERKALEAMKWVLWGTEVPDARPFGFARAF